MTRIITDRIEEATTELDHALIEYDLDSEYRIIVDDSELADTEYVLDGNGIKYSEV